MSKHSTKLMIIEILDILRKYSDENHPLTQTDIGKLVKKEYEHKPDRKSIKRNLADLLEYGYNIEYKEIPRANAGTSADDFEDEDEKSDNENIQLTDFRFIHDFTDAELKLLIDGLLFSRNIPVNQRKDLIEKLEGLSSIHFKTGAKNILTVQSDGTRSKDLFYNIEIIDEAIRENKRVDFHYLEYQSDKALHKRITRNGKERRFEISPYNIVASNGRYYVIGNNDFFDKDSKELIHFRIDRIVDLKIVDKAPKPLSEITDNASFSISKHMAEHIYMFSDEPIKVKFIINKKLLSELFDWFDPEDIRFSNETEEEITVTLTCSFEAMRLWATQFARYVTIISPEKLKEQVKEDIKAAYDRYTALE